MESLVSQPGAGPRTRLHEIDGLRALAIVLVVIHHTLTGSVYDYLRAVGHPALAALVGHLTNSGVELFFVLSGVVLMRPYLRGRRSFALRLYTRRRIERLWPPYLVAWLFAGLIVFMVSRAPTWYSAVLPTFGVADWLSQLAIVNLGWPIYNLAWWSLTPELYFYACVPVFIALRGRWATPPSHALGLGMTFAVLAIVLWDPKYSFPTVHATWRTLVQYAAYLPCFFAGTLLARGEFSRRFGVAAVVLGLLWLGASQILPRMDVHTSFALLYMGLLILTMHQGTLRRVFSGRFAVWLGERSYSLFLTHFSVLYAVCYLASLYFPGRTMAYFLVTRAVSAPVMLVVAMLLFSLIERRFARGLVTAEEFWPWSRTEGESTEPRSDGLARA